MKSIMPGIMMSIMRAWVGSMPVWGIIFCCPNIEAAIRIGRIRTGRSTPGKVKRVAGADRSLIHNMKGAWRRSIEL